MDVILLPREVDFGNLFEEVYRPGIPECVPECMVTLSSVRRSAVRLDAESFPLPRGLRHHISITYTPAERDYEKHATTLSLDVTGSKDGRLEIPIRGEFVFFP